MKHIFWIGEISKLFENMICMTIVEPTSDLGSPAKLVLGERGGKFHQQSFVEVTWNNLALPVSDASGA